MEKFSKETQAACALLHICGCRYRKVPAWEILRESQYYEATRGLFETEEAVDEALLAATEWPHRVVNYIKGESHPAWPRLWNFRDNEVPENVKKLAAVIKATEICPADKPDDPTNLRSCYTVADGSVQRSIHVEDGKVVLGEEGRGRELTRVPLPEGAIVEDGRLVAVPGGQPGDVVVCFRDHSGFRGRWFLLPARSEDDWRHIVARREYHAANGVAFEEGHILDATDDEWYNRDCPVCYERFGRFPRPYFPRDTRRIVREIARGICAQGAAGKAGGGAELLLHVPAGVRLEIHRTGRLYGKPHWLVVENKDGELVIYDPWQKAKEQLAVQKW